MPKRKEQEKDRKIAIFILFIVLIALIYVLGKNISNKPLETRVIETRFLVGETAGFDVNSSALIFGRVTPGNGATRDITLDNDNDFPIEVRVFIDRELAEYITVDAPFFIDAKDKHTASFGLSVPIDMSYGEYQGNIYFVMRKAR